MTEETTRPTLARRHLGRMLRRLRHEAGKTHADLTTAGLGSRSKLSAIESGRLRVRAETIYSLSAFYRLAPELTGQLLDLASATRQTGVYELRDPSMPERFGMYAELVDTASVLRAHCVELIHGLLQTEDYARAVISADPTLPPATVEQRVAFRLRRQEAFLSRDSTGRLEVVVTAGALTLEVGSSAVTQRQLAHLRAVDKTERVDVRVLTTGNGLHAAMRGGGFLLMDFADPLDPPLVYIDKIVGAEYIERVDYLDTYRRAFDAISAKAVPIEEYS